MERGSKGESRGVEQAAWPLRRLALKVLDLEGVATYYRELGLVELYRQPGEVALGAEDNELLRLRAIPGGRPRPPRSAGLFHFAILLPDQNWLGSFLKRSLEAGPPIDGASDHLVSQALYLSDPEGNGIEVYADRASAGWQWDPEGRVRMSTLPLDIPTLLEGAKPFTVFPPATRLGHVHLTVGDLDAAAAFYRGLGMEVTADWGPFRFLSWDGYHHHLGINLAAGRGVPPISPEVTGIEWFELARPGVPPGEDRDPSGIGVRRQT